MQYVILECSKTLTLWRWAAERGIPFWIPIHEVDGRQAAAMPGYGFVPEQHRSEMLKAVPPHFQVRIFAYNDYGVPRTCHEDELFAMQAVLDGPPTVAAEPGYEYKVGERIRIVHGPFAGHEAVIEKLRGSNVRLVTNKGYLSLPREFIAPFYFIC